jgi:hypothetical protein
MTLPISLKDALIEVQSLYSFLNHLVLVRPDDLELIRIWRNDQLPILRQQLPIESNQQKKYWKDVAWPEMSKPYPSLLLFGYKLNKNLIGYGGFVRIDWIQKHAELSSLFMTSLALSKSFIPLSAYYLSLSFMLAQRMGLSSLKIEIFDHRLDLIWLFHELGFDFFEYQNKRKLVEDKEFGAWFGSIEITPIKSIQIQKRLQNIDQSAFQELLHSFESSAH